MSSEEEIHEGKKTLKLCIFGYLSDHAVSRIQISLYDAGIHRNVDLELPLFLLSQ